MIAGRPKGYTDQDVEQLERIILERICDFNFPILMKVNNGHADPIIAGVHVRLDSPQNLFEILESAVL